MCACTENKEGGEITIHICQRASETMLLIKSQWERIAKSYWINLQEDNGKIGDKNISMQRTRRPVQSGETRIFFGRRLQRKITSGLDRCEIFDRTRRNVSKYYFIFVSIRAQHVRMTSWCIRKSQETNFPRFSFDVQSQTSQTLKKKTTSIWKFS